MPSNRFSFAIFVSRKDDPIRFLCELLEVCNDWFRLCGDCVLWFEVVSHINTNLAFGQIANWRWVKLDNEIFADKFTNRFGFSRRFDNDQYICTSLSQWDPQFSLSHIRIVSEITGICGFRAVIRSSSLAFSIILSMSASARFL